MAVTMEELTEYDWEDFLTEELYEEALESYIEQMTNKITDMEDTAVTEEMEKQRQTKHKITILTEEELEKAYTYVELNFGKTYLTPAEEKRMNYLMCRNFTGTAAFILQKEFLRIRSNETISTNMQCD